MALISKPNFGELVEAERWDAETYTPLLRALDVRFRNEPTLVSLATVTHPTEIPRIYSEREDAVPFFRAQNIRPILPETDSLVLIPREVAESLPTNRLETGDVLVTRSGAFSGVATAYLGPTGTCYTSGEGVILRSRGNIDGAYLAVFLNTVPGGALCRRAIYGSGQPHIGPKYLERMRVPRLGRLESTSADLVRRAQQELQSAGSVYPEAEAELLDRLGWSKVARQPREVSFSADFSRLKTAGRSDAEYFHPHAARIHAMLAKQRRYISEVADLRGETFTPELGRSFHYIEIRDISANTAVSGTEFRGEDAPSRAQQYVRAGDVITSTVRPLRRLSGLVAPEQDGWVCSSGFAVLKSRGVPPEYLVAYLRLPPVCELMDAWTLASMYPAIRVPDLLRLPVFLPEKHLLNRICAAVVTAREAQKRAQAKLAEAKQLIEDAFSNNQRQ
jgi:hypothetical protein